MDQEESDRNIHKDNFVTTQYRQGQAMYLPCLQQGIYKEVHIFIAFVYSFRNKLWRPIQAVYIPDSKEISNLPLPYGTALLWEGYNSAQLTVLCGELLNITSSTSIHIL